MVIIDRKDRLIVPPFRAMLARIRPRQLALSVAIDDLGSIRKAAERVGVSQPAATKMLVELEQSLGLALFERHRRGMTATVYGRALVRHAHLILADLGNLRDELAGLASGTAGTLSVGAITAAAAGPLAIAIAELKRRRPMLDVSVLVDTSDNLLPILEQGRLDIVVGRPIESAASAGIDFVVIGEETLSVVVRAAHPMAGRETLRLADLMESGWVLQPRSSPLRQLVEATFRDAGFDTPQDIVETGSILAATTLLQHTDMVAVVPRSVALHYVSSGLLATLPISFDRQLDPYGAMILRRRVQTPALIDFMQVLVSSGMRRLV